MLMPATIASRLTCILNAERVVGVGLGVGGMVLGFVGCCSQGLSELPVRVA